MKEIVCSFNRPHSFSELFQLGSMSFQVDLEWAKWPDEFMGIHVMNTCWGDDGFLYAATDRSEAPIVVMDGKGQFVRAIGQGLFQKAHSVFCTAKDTLIVADAGKNSHFIREITPQGQLVRTFGTPGVPETAAMSSTISLPWRQKIVSPRSILGAPIQKLWPVWTVSKSEVAPSAVLVLCFSQMMVCITLQTAMGTVLSTALIPMGII